MDHQEYNDKCNLIGNPFRPNSNADKDPRRGIWVGYEEVRGQLSKLLARSRADQIGSINFGLVHGDLGTGKSHALMWCQYQVMVDKKDEYKSLAYYVPTLVKDKNRMSFGTAFQEDIVERSNFIHDVMEYAVFLDQQTSKYKESKGYGSEISKSKVLEEMLPSLESINLARQVLECVAVEPTRKLLSSANGDHQAMLLFTRLSNLFTHNFNTENGDERFKQAVYLFIDELDELAFVPAKEAREVNSLFRHIYDQCPANFCMLLGFTATAAEINVLFEEFVTSRADRVINLDYLQPDDAVEFVKEILDFSRPDGSKPNGYYPFTKDAIGAVVGQLVSITPRKLVKHMEQVIEECRLRDMDPTVAPISPEMLDDKNVWDDIS